MLSTTRPTLQRRVDGEVGRLGDEEGRGRCNHQSRWREQAGDGRTNADRDECCPDAEATLDEIAQDQRQPDHQHAGRAHQAGGHGNEAGAIGDALRADAADHPVGGGYGQSEEGEEHEALGRAAAVGGHGDYLRFLERNEMARLVCQRALAYRAPCFTRLRTVAPERHGW